MTPCTDYHRVMQRIDRRRQLRAVLYVVLGAASFVAIAAVEYFK